MVCSIRPLADVARFFTQLRSSSRTAQEIVEVFEVERVQMGIALVVIALLLAQREGIVAPPEYRKIHRSSAKETRFTLRASPDVVTVPTTLRIRPAARRYDRLRPA